MRHTFEEAAALAQSRANLMDDTHFEVFSAGMVDLRDRLTHLELCHLEDRHRLTETEKRIDDVETRLRSVEGDRNEYGRRVDAVEKTPNDNAKRLEAVEKRLSTIEGAVGSARFKATKSETAVAPPVLEPPKAT